MLNRLRSVLRVAQGKQGQPNAVVLRRAPVIQKQPALESNLPAKELCRRHGFSEASRYLWRSEFGGMSVSEAKRLKDSTEIDRWRREYNEERPKKGIGGLTFAAYAKQLAAKPLR